MSYLFRNNSSRKQYSAHFLDENTIDTWDCRDNTNCDKMSNNRIKNNRTTKHDLSHNQNHNQHPLEEIKRPLTRALWRWTFENRSSLLLANYSWCFRAKANSEADQPLPARRYVLLRLWGSKCIAWRLSPKTNIQQSITMNIQRDLNSAISSHISKRCAEARPQHQENARTSTKRFMSLEKSVLAAPHRHTQADTERAEV